MSTPDETRADTSVFGPVQDHDATLTFPAITAGDPAPRPPAIHCPDCGETFAEAGLGGRALFLAETLHAAALAAGWAENGGKWTCSVCLAGITGPLYGPEREPAPALSAPDTDPYRQYADMSAEIVAGIAGFWEHENAEHNAASARIRMRLHDAQVRIGELTGAAA